jgi:hypothetical protein
MRLEYREPVRISYDYPKSESPWTIENYKYFLSFMQGLMEKKSLFASLPPTLCKKHACSGEKNEAGLLWSATFTIFKLLGGLILSCSHLHFNF